MSDLSEKYEHIIANNPDIASAYNDMLLFLNEKYPKDEIIKQNYVEDFKRGVLEFRNNKDIIIVGKNIKIRKACIEDADFISKTEQDPDNSPWVANWPLFIRICRFGNADFLQTVIETNDGYPVGFIIFRDMLNKSTQIELKRIAVSEKGKGYGKEALHLAWKIAFEILNTKKLYLHTKSKNIRAQSIYKHVGFTAETDDPCTSFYIHAEDYITKNNNIRMRSFI